MVSRHSSCQPNVGGGPRAGLLVAYSPQADSAVVDVVLTSSDLAATGRFVAFRVSLVWSNSDWRVVAPPDGDWGSVATTLGATPAGRLDYGG